MEPRFSDVFTKGDGGYELIRIPSVVVSKKHTLLAFAEGRAGTKSDQANNKIILKRSKDAGRTWSALQVVEDDGLNSLNNPCAVVDQPSGRIFLMYQRVPAGLSEGSGSLGDAIEGPNVYRCFLTWSDDDGLSWRPPVDITGSVKHPTAVKTICSGPGIGIQLERGPYKGRLIMPFNEGPFYMWNNYAVFSDDHGTSWRTGENAPGDFILDAKGKERSQINEVQMAESSDGSVLLNSRQFAGAPLRKSAVSYDGGQTWSSVKDVSELRDPSCMGSIVRYSYGQGHDLGVILFSGPDSKDRENGTVYASFDDGKTWPVKRVLVPGDFAYSVLTRLPDGKVGCLFETDGYKKIKFATFDIRWVTDQKALGVRR